MIIDVSTNKNKLKSLNSESNIYEKAGLPSLQERHITNKKEPTGQKMTGFEKEGARAPLRVTNKKSRYKITTFEPPVGFEPTTRALQVRCSGQLS